MLQALTGFVVIGVVIAAGWLLARLGVVGERAHVTLSRVAFFAASPALLFTVLARADLRVLFSGFQLVQDVA
ncbi:MAG: AEC family transporter, partial [Micrococcales bacterium]|nr:AEC family transporter [Micrococcales bacterium]